MNATAVITEEPTEDLSAVDAAYEAGAVDEQLVAERAAVATFYSRRKSLRLVIEPRYEQVAPQTGRALGRSPGVTVEFKENHLALPGSGPVKIANGRKAEAEDLLEALREHDLFKDVHDGFWEVDPSAPPAAAEELQRLVTAGLAGDIATLEKMAGQERAGWQRSELLALIAESIDQVKDAKAREDAAMDALRERARAEARAEIEAEMAAQTDTEASTEPEKPATGRAKSKPAGDDAAESKE